MLRGFIYGALLLISLYGLSYFANEADGNPHMIMSILELF